MNTIKKLLLISLVFIQAKSHFETCLSVEQYNEHMKDLIISEINIEQFLQEELPEPDEYAKSSENTGLIFMGAGAFGRVYQIELKIDQEDEDFEEEEELPAVMKVVRYAEFSDNQLDHLSTEVDCLQNFTEENQPFLIKYYNCVHSEESKTIMLFLEYMPFTAQDDYLEGLIFGSKRFTLEAYLEMASAVKVFHDYNMTHTDIKPDNFVYSLQQDELLPPLIKIIDYGLLMHPGYEGHAGTPSFLDPQMSQDNFVLSLKSDIYSLGMTFHYILYGNEGIHLHSSKQIETPELSKAFYADRFEKTHEAQGKAEAFLKEEGQEDEAVILKKINDLIQKMTAFEQDDRPSIDEVVNTLNEALKEVDDTDKALVEYQKTKLIDLYYPYEKKAMIDYRKGGNLTNEVEYVEEELESEHSGFNENESGSQSLEFNSNHSTLSIENLELNNTRDTVISKRKALQEPKYDILKLLAIRQDNLLNKKQNQNKLVNDFKYRTGKENKILTYQLKQGKGITNRNQQKMKLFI